MGHHDATMDPDIIEAWWTRWPDAMIGSPIPADQLVIDIDPCNGGSLTEVEAFTGPLPETLIVWSGRDDGGHHRYYKRPDGPFTGTRLPNDIDLKAAGYTILPPSIHPPTGQPYRWEEHPVAPLPSGLLELLRPDGRSAGHSASANPRGWPTAEALAGLLRTVATTQVGDRNKVLFWAACRVHEHNYGPAAVEALADAARHAGLGGRAITATLRSAERRVA